MSTITIELPDEADRGDGSTGSFILALGRAGVDAIQVSAQGTQGGGRE